MQTRCLKISFIRVSKLHLLIILPQSHSTPMIQVSFSFLLNKYLAGFPYSGTSIKYYQHGGSTVSYQSFNVPTASDEWTIDVRAWKTLATWTIFILKNVVTAQGNADKSLSLKFGNSLTFYQTNSKFIPDSYFFQLTLIKEAGINATKVFANGVYLESVPSSAIIPTTTLDIYSGGGTTLILKEFRLWNAVLPLNLVYQLSFKVLPENFLQSSLLLYVVNRWCETQGFIRIFVNKVGELKPGSFMRSTAMTDVQLCLQYQTYTGTACKDIKYIQFNTYPASSLFQNL